jgi:hypothetical protein
MLKTAERETLLRAKPRREGICVPVLPTHLAKLLALGAD